MHYHQLHNLYIQIILIARKQCELAQNSANIEREQPKMGSWAPNYPDGTLGPLGPLPP